MVLHYKQELDSSALEIFITPDEKVCYLEHKLTTTINFFVPLQVPFGQLLFSHRSSAFSRWCTSYFGAYFGSFKIDPFPRSQKRVQLCAFHSLTFKVSFKCTSDVLRSPNVKPPSHSQVTIKSQSQSRHSHVTVKSQSRHSTSLSRHSHSHVSHVSHVTVTSQSQHVTVTVKSQSQSQSSHSHSHSQVTIKSQSCHSHSHVTVTSQSQSSHSHSQVKSSLFNRGGPFSTRLVSIGALRNL